MISLKKLHIISLLPLMSSGSIFCMKLVTVKLPCKKFEIKNKDVKKRSIEIIRNCYQNKDIADPSADIRVINDRRAQMQEKINNKYQALSMCIQQMYNIDFDFCTYFQNIEKHLTITNEQKENVLSEIPTQQEVRPSYFLSYLKKTLGKNNFGESLVTFTSYDNRCYIKLPVFSSRVEDDLLHIHVDKPGSINIRQYMLYDLSLNAQRGCCIALANLFKHTITAALFYHMVNAMTEKTIDEKEFYPLMLPNKTLSLLNLALKNAQATRLLLQFYIEDKDFLVTANDHKKLNIIDTFHHVLAWLKEYEQNNQKPAIKSTPASQHMICKSCLRKVKIADGSPDYPKLCYDCRSAQFNLEVLGFI